VPVSFFFDGAPQQAGFSGMGEAPSTGYVSDFLSSCAAGSLNSSKISRKIADHGK